ncbi:MAG TPA: nucleotide exchange factor GrpE [Bacteroidales bacterium]|nr:nucleotide exchange factor GrpE [Bacteroidales bacterium]
MKLKKEKEKETKTTEPKAATDNVSATAAETGHETIKGNDDAGQVLSAETELKQKIDEVNDKYLRLYSEFDNYRKRTIKEKVELSRTASEEIITALLPVIDDLERALKSLDEFEGHESQKEGFQLIFSKLKNILTAKGLTEIKAAGESFNVDIHEAVAHFPAPDEESKNKIIDEVQKGYMLNDKVIRFAKVVVGI